MDTHEEDSTPVEREAFCLPPRTLADIRAKIAQKLKGGSLGANADRLLPHAHYVGRSNQT